MSVRRPAPRPKRAGETFARTHHSTGDGPSASKRARFDVRNPSALAPDGPDEEDAVLELDEIGKGGQQTKRNAVNIDGYESDSSNEGFDARANAKASAAKKVGGPTATEQESDNEMFGDLEEDFKDGDLDEDMASEGKKSKKDVQFLDEKEIEGQVEGSKAGGHVSADFSLNGNDRRKGKRKALESSSESEDETANDDQEIDEEVGAGGKKVHAPKLSAFNMKEEHEEGRFDAQGNFVRKAADPAAVHDSWLEGISKKDQKRAREAEEKREEERRQKTLADDQVLTADVLKTLIVRLEKSETVLEALARLGTGNNKRKKKKSPKSFNDRKKAKSKDAEMDVDVDIKADEEEDVAETNRREAVEDITGAADLLLTRGQADIYDDTREALIRQYRRETGEEWVEPPQNDTRKSSDEDGDTSTQQTNKQWEYRWTDARDAGEVHGPYDGMDMLRWQDAGFFQEAVEFRRCAAAGQGEWSRLVDFV